MMANHTCHICGAPDVALLRLVQSPFVQARYSLLGCRQCGSVFFDPEEHAVDLRAFYNEDTYTVSAPFARTTYWKEQVRTISSLVRAEPYPWSILDIGCRTGDFLLHWDKRHRRVGVEVHRQNAAIAAARGLEVICDLAQNIHWKDQFTVVSCYAVLEHISHPQPLLETLCRTTAPGGVLAIMVPFHASWLRRRLDARGVYWHMYAPPGHLSFYSTRFLDGFMNGQGLRLAKRRYSSGGMASAYSAWSPGAALLRSGSYESLREYFTHTMSDTQMPDTCRFHPPARKVHQLIVDLLERYTPLQHFPYFDHMYAYYIKQ